MAEIYLKYGNYSHAVGECGFSERKRLIESAEKVPLYYECGWDIVNGMLIRSTQAELMAAIVALQRAYSVHGHDIGWYYVGGGATAHVVRNRNTMYGIRVVQPPQFPTSAPGELVAWRNYTIGLEWEEAASPQVGLVSSTQSLTYEGTGGPDWKYLLPIAGQPVSAAMTERSVVTVRQAGSAVGHGGYMPPANPPIWSGSPPLHGPSTHIATVRRANLAAEREVNWSYTFYFPSHPGVRNP